MALKGLNTPTDVANEIKNLATASTASVVNVLNRPGTTQLIATNGNTLSI